MVISLFFFFFLIDYFLGISAFFDSDSQGCWSQLNPRHCGNDTWYTLYTVSHRSAAMAISSV